MRFRCDRRIRLIVLGCLVLGVGATGASIAARQPPAEDFTSLIERLDDLARDKQRVQQKLRGVKRSQRRIGRQLAELDARMERADARLHRVTQSAGRVRTELEDASRKCEVAEARLADQQSCVADRLVAIYLRGETRPIEVLLQSTSFAEFANRLYLLNQVVGRDAEILEKYEQARASADARRGELREQTRSLVRLQDKIASEKRRASVEREATNRKKRSLLRDRAAWERALAELEQNSLEIEAMLQRLQQTPEGQERLAKPWTGGLLWPLRGRVSSDFGYRRHPIYRVRKMHTGLDIAASSGTRIRAAASGTVVHAARWGGYGNCVIVDHGGGLATIYAHCSRLAVRKGETVRQGDVVAYVGSTGLSTGPHLHFEVRRGGRPVSPTSFLR